MSADKVAYRRLTRLFTTGLSSSAVAQLYVLLFVPFGILCVSSIPLGQAADELAHILRAESLTYGEMTGVRSGLPTPDGRILPHQGVIADPEFQASVASPVQPAVTSPQLVDHAKLAASRELRFGGKPIFLDLGTIAGYFPAFYLPGAVAVAVAKTLGAGPNAAFRAARLANLVASCLIGVTAIAVAARGQALLLTLLLLPTTVSLAASASEDGLIIATSAFAVACVTRLQAGRRHQARTFWALTAAVALICLAKPPYAPIALLLLVPLSGGQSGARWRSSGLRAGLAGAIVFGSAAWMAYSLHQSSAPVYRAPVEAGPLWSGARPAIFDRTDPVAQLKVLLEQPLRFFTVPAATMIHQPEVFRQAIGVMGWLNLYVPRPLVFIWTIALMVAAVEPFSATMERRSFLSTAYAVGIVAVIFIAIDLIYLSQYLTFTNVGARLVQGMQGRYLLPLMPLWLLVAPACNPSSIGRIPLRSICLTLLATAANFFWLPPEIIRFYYFG